jgi:pyruvate ferredoxin oxidoreductase beta subunit
LFLSLASCPTGWGFAPENSDHIVRLAIDTGVWPLKEALDGRVRHTFIPNRLRPVEEYLRPQRRFHHLFSPTRQQGMLDQIQSNIDDYWAAVNPDLEQAQFANLDSERTKRHVDS